MHANPGWSGSAPTHDRMIFQLAEPAGEGDMVGLADKLVAKEQHLVLEQRFLDRSEQVVVPRRFRQIDALEFGTDVRRKFLDSHQTVKIEEPMVFPASRSRWACTASSSA
jgi:hypothetical protein